MNLPIAISAEYISGIESEGAFLEGSSELFSVMVKNYEPNVLVSSILEEQNVPVYVHLAALPTVPGFEPRIQNIIVRETGTNTLSGVSYHLPAIFSWDDFGYLQVNIRKFENEAKMPDRIDANLTATIIFESESLPGLIGSAGSKLLGEYKTDIKKEAEWFNDIQQNSDKYQIFSGKGYLVAKEINENSVKFVLFDSKGRVIDLSVKKGEESPAYLLVSGSARAEDYVRIRVDTIDMEKKETTVSVLTGKERGETKINFELHIPIEKRVIEFTPKFLSKEINRTGDMIKNLNNTIKNLEKVVDDWGKICLAVTAIIAIGQFFRGKSEASAVNRIATAASGWKEAEKAYDDAVLCQRNDPACNQESVNTLRQGYNEKRKNLYFLVAEQYLDPSDYEYYSEHYYGNGSDEKVQNIEDQILFKINLLGLGLSTQATTLPPGECVEVVEGFCKTHYFYDKTNKNKNSKIYFRDGSFYSYKKEGDRWDPIYNTVVYTESGEAYHYNSNTNAFELYTKPSKKEFESIYSATLENGEKITIIPIQDINKLPLNLGKLAKMWKDLHGDGIYIVHYDDKIEVYVVRGQIIDVGRKQGNDEIDQLLGTYSKGNIEFTEVETYFIKKIQDAQKTGKKEVDLGGMLALSAQKTFAEAGLSCYEMMPAWACKILFNVCDPIVCPSSRCNLGGLMKVDNVVQSGLIGSLVLCAPNIKDGVIVPICLTGVLASLKNIRSYIEGYQKCLNVALKEGKSVGVCDRIRSIYVCEIVVKEIFDLLNFKGGLAGAIAGKVTNKLTGGSEYINGVKTPVSESKKFVNFFVQDYAKQIFAAYEGRTTKEVGTELCKSAIAGKFPSIGDFISEISKGENPVQYTANFEEHTYAEVAGNSRYMVYYHIYAGTSTQPVNYAVYLKNCGNIINFEIGKGTIQTEGFVDEAIDKIGPSKCQEICIVINGKTECVFGKTVSTSVGLQALADKYTVENAGREIKWAKSCVPTTDAILGASVDRQCALSNPSLGENKESKWKNVGSCNNEDGSSSGYCWMYINTNDLDIKNKIDEEICKDKICNINQKCKGITINDLDKTKRTVCCDGLCEDKSFVEDIKKIINPTNDGWSEWENKYWLNVNEWNLLNEWFDLIKKNGEVDNYKVIGDKVRDLMDLVNRKHTYVYFYIGMKFMYEGDYEDADKCFKKITGSTLGGESNGVYLKALGELDDKTQLQEACKIYTGKTSDALRAIGAETCSSLLPVSTSGTLLIPTENHIPLNPAEMTIKDVKVGDEITFSQVFGGRTFVVTNIDITTGIIIIYSENFPIFNSKNLEIKLDKFDIIKIERPETSTIEKIQLSLSMLLSSLRENDILTFENEEFYTVSEVDVSIDRIIIYSEGSPIIIANDLELNLYNSKLINTNFKIIKVERLST